MKIVTSTVGYFFTVIAQHALLQRSVFDSTEFVNAKLICQNFLINMLIFISCISDSRGENINQLNQDSLAQISIPLQVATHCVM